MGGTMKKATYITLASLVLPLANASTGLASDFYHPYQTYEEYHRIHSPEPPPSPPPASGQPQPREEVKEPPQARQPLKVTEAPEILFPPKLGFGVAVGVPYDMFYASGAYYTVQGSAWYRSSSYKGPWTLQGLSQLPPELRKHKLSEIHKIRNSEFEKYWENKENYKGRHFRAGEEVGEPPKKQPVKEQKR